MLAPYKDYKGQSICDGDVIRSWFGGEGIVIHDPDAKTEDHEWRVVWNTGHHGILRVAVSENQQCVISKTNWKKENKTQWPA